MEISARIVEAESGAEPRVPAADLRRLVRLGLHRMIPARTTRFVLTRRIRRREGPPRREDGVRVEWVEGDGGTPRVRLVRIAAELGLDVNWCDEQLANGAQAVLAMKGSEPIGFSLMTRRTSWIEEIQHWFEPGPGGCYFYATYVTPAFRGQRIQQLMDQERFCRLGSQGVRWAHVIVDEANAASLRSHHVAGFVQATRIDRVRFGPMSLFAIRKLTSFVRGGQLAHDGVLSRCAVHVAWQG